MTAMNPMRSMAMTLTVLASLLTACTGNRKPEPPKVVEVIVTKYVQVPAVLSADCQNETPKAQTYAEAKRLALVRNEYLAECTERMRKIRGLK